MRVRVGVLGDLEAVVGLERGAAEAPHWAEGEYRAALADGRRVFVGEVDGFVVGFVVGVRADGGGGEIENLVVGEGSRRGGVGRALCLAVLAWCGGAVMLEVRESNGGARALYEGLGFAEVGRRRQYYRDPVEDGLVMRVG